MGSWKLRYECAVLDRRRLGNAELRGLVAEVALAAGGWRLAAGGWRRWEELGGAVAARLSDWLSDSSTVPLRTIVLHQAYLREGKYFRSDMLLASFNPALPCASHPAPLLR